MMLTPTCQLLSNMARENEGSSLLSRWVACMEDCRASPDHWLSQCSESHREYHIIEWHHSNISQSREHYTTWCKSRGWPVCGVVWMSVQHGWLRCRQQGKKVYSTTEHKATQKSSSHYCIKLVRWESYTCTSNMVLKKATCWNHIVCEAFIPLVLQLYVLISLMEKYNIDWWQHHKPLE